MVAEWRYAMPILNAIAGAILVAFGLFLIVVTVVVFARLAVAERFFMSFASSARTHYTEQVVRLLVGASLIIHSAAMTEAGVAAMSVRVTVRQYGRAVLHGGGSCQISQGQQGHNYKVVCG